MQPGAVYHFPKQDNLTPRFPRLHALFTIIWFRPAHVGTPWYRRLHQLTLTFKEK